MKQIEFAGYASAFNIIDKHRDVIEKGAFNTTIKNFGHEYVDLLFSHDITQKVGKLTKLTEDSYGLYIEGIIDTNLPKSLKLINSIQNNEISSFSIGYYPRDIQKKGLINYIYDLNLIEISFVHSPANSAAKILNVSGVYTDPWITNIFNKIKNFSQSILN